MGANNVGVTGKKVKEPNATAAWMEGLPHVWKKHGENISNLVSIIKTYDEKTYIQCYDRWR